MTLLTAGAAAEVKALQAAAKAAKLAKAGKAAERARKAAERSVEAAQSAGQKLADIPSSSGLPRGDIPASEELLRQLRKRHRVDQSAEAQEILRQQHANASIYPPDRSMRLSTDVTRIEVFEEKIHSSILDIWKRNGWWDGKSELTDIQWLQLEIETHQWLLKKAADLKLTNAEINSLSARLDLYKALGDALWGRLPKRK